MPRECGRKPFGEIAIIVSLLAAGLALVLVVASLPMKALVGIVPDDAFYYLVVGRNLAATGVSTFDGQNLASGYHPGWMMLVTMAARFVSDSDQLVRIIVVMGFAFHILAGWLLYRCLQRFVPGNTAALAAGFWMFGYLPLIVASFALETSLYCVAFLAELLGVSRSNRALAPTGSKPASPCRRRLLSPIARRRPQNRRQESPPTAGRPKQHSHDESSPVWHRLGFVPLGSHRSHLAPGLRGLLARPGGPFFVACGGRLRRREDVAGKKAMDR